MNQLLYIVWNPDLVAFRLGPLSVRWYGLMWAIGIVLAFLVVKRLYKEQKIKDEFFAPLYIYCFFGILIGARLGHCLFYEPDHFLTSGKGFVEMFLPIRFLTDGGWKYIGYQGLASHGGTFGLIVALWLYVRKTKLSIWNVLDNIAIATGTTACFIRLGNLMNSEIIGKITDVPWAFIFEKVDMMPRHPGQLYEAIAYAALFFIMWILHKRMPEKIGTGWYFGFCLTYIFTFRFFIEYISKIEIEPYGVETVPVIAVSPKTLKLIPTATAQLNASVSPAAETVWASSDETVATVDAKGVVTAIAVGTAIITNTWTSTISDATSSDACEVTVADIDLSEYNVAKAYDFTTMGDVTLTLQEEAAGAIWNEANSKTNNVFFCTNEGLELIAVQAAVASNKGWSITEAGLTLASGAGRCAAVGGIKKDQVVEFIYTGDGFYTRSTDDGIDKTALNEGKGRAIYLANEDGMIGFELVKGNAVKQINIYEKPVVEVGEDYTDRIVNADLTGEGGWNADGTKGIDKSGIVKCGNNAQFDFSQTITLPNGEYKLSAKATYRYSGSEQDEYDAIQAGTETKFAKLYATVAGNTESTLVKNRYDCASETDYAAGNGSVQVNELWVPNSSNAVKAWFEAGQYVNDVFFIVTTESPVTIGIVKTEQPGPGDYTVIGPWTLTRLGDAVVDGIESVPTTKTAQQGIFNLAGQRVQKAGKGLYIINGKKVVK